MNKQVSLFESGDISLSFEVRCYLSKDCNAKLSDKQQKLEQKTAELQGIKEKVNYYDVACVRFDVPEIKVRPPKITERPPRFGNIDDWTKTQNATISEQFHNALNSFGKTVMDAAKNSILGERKFRLLNQRERDAIGEELQSIKYLRHQQIHESLSLIFFTKNYKYRR